MNEGPSLLEPVEEPSAPSANPGKRWTWDRFGPFVSKVALELFIVFVGVSAAFALDDYRSDREQAERRDAVYQALDRELKQIAETHGPVFQTEMLRQLAEWDQAVARGERPLPPAFRLPRAERPPSGVWDAAVSSGSIELINPEFFYELARYYNRANTVGEYYRRYASEADAKIWPRLRDGSGAFWLANGSLRLEVEIHVRRLREFRSRQAELVKEAQGLRTKLAKAAEDDRS